MTAVDILPQPTQKLESSHQTEETPTFEVSEQAKEAERHDAFATINLAAEDVRSVLEQQRQQGHMLTTKLNILFVVNGALLTSLTLSKLMFLPSVFSFGEIIGFLVNFTLLINAFLPRQVAVSPNLSIQFLERYLNLTPQKYQLKMMVNLIETYNTNKQRLDDISQTLSYAAYVTWTIALMIMLHVVAAYFVPVMQMSSFG